MVMTRDPAARCHRQAAAPSLGVEGLPYTITYKKEFRALKGHRVAGCGGTHL
jgi:hypothetical protein